MSPHIRKLVATIAMLFWLAVYALLVSGLAVRILPHAAWYVSVAFYALAGTLWIVPIGLALPWMHRGPVRR